MPRDTQWQVPDWNLDFRPQGPLAPTPPVLCLLWISGFWASPRHPSLLLEVGGWLGLAAAATDLSVPVPCPCVPGCGGSTPPP